MRCSLLLVVPSVSALVPMSGSKPVLQRRAPPPAAIAVPPVLAPAAGIAVLTSVIVVHECGHLFAARSQGIRVSEFSIGFGPQLARLPPRHPSGVPIVLRALPIGGYVSFPRLVNRTALEERGLLRPGEELDAELDVEDGPDLLERRPIRERALVIAGGVLANILLSFALLFASAGTLGAPCTVYDTVVISRVVPGSAADAAGFRSGDRLIKVTAVADVDRQRNDGAEAKRRSAGQRARGQPGEASRSAAAPLQSSLDEIGSAIRSHARIDAVVERAGTRVELRVPPLPRGTPALGVELTAPAIGRTRVKLPPARAAAHAVRAVRDDGVAIVRGLQSALGALLLPTKDAATQATVQGPIGIARVGADVASSDALVLLEFGALLSLNLAAFNAVPLPGLDGWQMLLLAVEGATRRQLPARAAELVNVLAGMLLVVAFSRVLLSDVSAAVGPAAASSARAAIEGALREYGPSLTLGLLLVAALRGSGAAAGKQDQQSKQRPPRRTPSRANENQKKRWWRWDAWN